MNKDIRAFDVFWVDLNDALGSEQSKVRPCIIVQIDKGNINSPTTIVVGLTHGRKKLYLPTHVLVKKANYNWLGEDSTVLGEQIRVVDKNRLRNKIGHISDYDTKKQIINAFSAGLVSSETIEEDFEYAM